MNMKEEPLPSTSGATNKPKGTPRIKPKKEKNTPKTPTKTPMKKEANKAIKDDPITETPSTSKKVTNDNENEEWGTIDILNRGDLPDYAAKFGMEKVKIDRFKLNIPHTNLLYLAIDELCLEGLDGITIEAFWTRLSIALKQPLPLPSTIANFIWNIIRTKKDIEFYKLHQPRPKLAIFDRYQNGDPELGSAMDPVEAPLDIYPYHPIKEGEILGSAASFESRENITNTVRNLTLQEAELTYGQSLVMVGTQRLRTKVLLNPLSDPNMEFTLAQYCLLERIGRSRRLGEVTQGKVSLQVISKDPKIIFYTRKILAENKLVSKQPLFMKSATSNLLTGSLLHLTRFYNEKKTKTQIMTEQIVEVLRNRPAYRMEYSEAKAVFGNPVALNKLFKLPDFQRFVKTDVQLRFRDVYPNASVKEWKLKGNGKERRIRTIELINPTINIGGAWNEEEPKEESSDEEETKEIVYNAPILHQIYNYIRTGGPDGRSLKEIQANKGMDFYSVRAAVNQLVNQSLVLGVKIDIGRQRLIKYHTCDYHSNEIEGIPPTPEQLIEAEQLERESIDFLADLLEVDPAYLREENVPEVSDSTQKVDRGTYTLIKELRRGNKQTKDNRITQVTVSKERLKVENVTENAGEMDRNLLERIFKNQHDYSTSNNILTINNEMVDFNAISASTCFKNISEEICTSSNCDDVIKNRKKRKIHKRLLAKIRRSETNESPSVETLLKDMACPLIFPSKDFTSKPRYRKLFKRVLKVVRPLMTHFNYKVKALMPKKSYMCRQKLPKDKLQQFSKDHPLLSLATDPPTKSTPQIDSAGNKRKADELETEASKRMRLEDPTQDSPWGTFNIYMGPNPTLAYHSVDDDNIEISVLVSTKPEEFDEPGSKYIKDNNATLRTLKRAHCILEAVRQEKVITDIRRLHKMIQSQDSEDGYNVKVDRKSIERIYVRLVRGGHIKVLQVILKAPDAKRSVTVICDPSLDIQHSMVESVIEQLKMKFFITARRKDWDVTQVRQTSEGVMSQFETSEINCSVGELKLLASNDSPYLYNRNIGKDYGHAPKFMRMRVLHEFLFHLIYNYPYEQQVEVDDVPALFQELNLGVEEDLIKELPRIYCREVSWKMFIPSLPRHEGWTDGWALVCDILLRLPLSLFVKLYNVSFVIPELPMYLEHPVKQYYLVKHLPSDIRNGILHRRKYIFSIHETLARLCYIGILQFGPQKLKEKDQLFIYLNRNASLLDTTTSNAGYHYVEDKPYKKLFYHFATPKDVETYWYEMWNICAHSKLGLRNTVTGTYITIEQVETKPAMIEAMKAKNAQQAKLCDDGSVPGDKRGAAGLDSALWSHIKRNWIWCNRIVKSQPENSHTDAAMVSLNKSKDKELKTHKKKLAKSSVRKESEKGAEDNLLPVTESNRRTYKKVKVAPAKKHTETKRKGKNYIRKVLPRVDMKKRKDYDSIDKNLMANLKQSRSEWNEEEDKVLQICKIVATFLCPNVRKQNVPYTIIRDVLHRLSPISCNKTSGACQRRLNVIFGNSDQQEYLQHIVRTVCHIAFVRKYFQKFYETLNAGNNLSEKQLHGAFVYLAVHFFKHQHEIQHIFEAISYKYQVEHKSSKSKVLGKGESSTSSPTKHLSTEKPASQVKTSQLSGYDSEFVEVIAYECTEPTDPKYLNRKLYSHTSTFPVTEKEVILDTVKSIIHSTIGSRQEDTSWICLLFRVYQNYPDELLKRALFEIRNSQMVSIKRFYTRRQDEAETLPITTKFFQFSFYYCFTQITKFPPELFQEAHETFLGIVKHKEPLMDSSTNGLPLECFEQGHTVGLTEIAVDVDTYFYVDIPKEVLILNPKIADHTELIKELAVRYKKMLTLVKEGTYFRDDENDANTQAEADEVDFPKQPKPPSRTPMIQRFLKSWFLTDELDEVTDDIEDFSVPPDAAQKQLEEESAASQREAKTEEPEKRMGKSDKKKKRTTQMTSEESKKILESLNPQLCLRKQDGSSKGPKKQVQKVKAHGDPNIPVGTTVSDLSFEDYEKKLETLLSTSAFSTPVEIAQEDNQEGEDVPDTKGLGDFSEDANILEKYLKSKKNIKIEHVVAAGQTEQIYLPELQPVTEGPLENTDGDPITNSRIQYLMNDDLTVEQIMEEMLVDCPAEERKVPNPINLARLLVKGLFPELDEDEERLERLHQHFLIICPDINLLLTDFEDNDELRYLQMEHSQTCKALLRKVQKDIIVGEKSSNSVLSNKLKSMDATDLDIFVAETLVDFVCKKRVLGANIKQLKEHFSNLENIKLSTLLHCLTSMNILIRTGVTYVIYVHYKYKKHWLCESCTLADQDKVKLVETKAEDSEVDPTTMVKSLESCTEIKVKIMPWARIDGTLNLKVFEKWMCTVLGYCLSDMMVPLSGVVRSCCYLKPVEVYYLVECLQELGCVQMYVYNCEKPSLFSEASYTDMVPAEVTDAFEDIYIESDRFAVIKFGTLINKKMKEFDFVSDETKKYGAL